MLLQYSGILGTAKGHNKGAFTTQEHLFGALEALARTRCLSGLHGYHEPDRVRISHLEEIDRAAVGAVLRGIYPFQIKMWLDALVDAHRGEREMAEDAMKLKEMAGSRMMLFTAEEFSRYPKSLALALQQELLGLRELNAEETCVLNGMPDHTGINLYGGNVAKTRKEKLKEWVNKAGVSLYL